MSSSDLRSQALLQWKHNKVQKSKYNVGKSIDVHMSLNSNVQKSGALQRNKNDSLSISFDNSTKALQA